MQVSTKAFAFDAQQPPRGYYDDVFNDTRSLLVHDGQRPLQWSDVKEQCPSGNEILFNFDAWDSRADEINGNLHLFNSSPPPSPRRAPPSHITRPPHTSLSSPFSPDVFQGGPSFSADPVTIIENETNHPHCQHLEVSDELLPYHNDDGHHSHHHHNHHHHQHQHQRDIKVKPDSISQKKKLFSTKIHLSEYDLSEGEFNTLVDYHSDIRKVESDYFLCGCRSGLFSHEMELLCIKAKPGRSKGGKQLTGNSGRVVECSKTLLFPGDTQPRKSLPQNKYPKDTAIVFCPVGCCTGFHWAAKQWLAFLQLCGGCKFDLKQRTKSAHVVSITSLLKAKKILILVGRKVDWWIDWAYNLIPSFSQPLGGREHMMNCTRLFFSNRMSERARTLLINARSSDIDGPSLLKNMKQEMIKKNPVTFTSQKEEEDNKEEAEEEDDCKERDPCYETVLSSKAQQFMHALTTKMMEEGNVELKWSEFEKILATITTQMREDHHEEEDKRDLKADPEEKENVEDLKDLVKSDMEDVTKEIIKEVSTNKKKKRTSARVAARTLQNSSSSFSIAASVGQKRRRSSPTAE